MVKNRFWDLDRKTIKIKICGIKTIDVAYNAYLLGADALGFHLWSWDDENIYEYKIKTFRTLLSFLPSDISNFLLTDIKDHKTILSILRNIPEIDTLQIQGEITLKELEKICRFLKTEIPNLYIVKTIPPREDELTFCLRDLEKIVDGIVIDSGWYGGSGKPHNWYESAKIATKLTKPVILAGGLNFKNVKDAIKIVHPYGVDVESGVEDVLLNHSGNKTKVKNFIKIRKFIKSIKGGCDD